MQESLHPRNILNMSLANLFVMHFDGKRINVCLWHHFWLEEKNQCAFGRISTQKILVAREILSLTNIVAVSRQSLLSFLHQPVKRKEIMNDLALNSLQPKVCGSLSILKPSRGIKLGHEATGFSPLDKNATVIKLRLTCHNQTLATEIDVITRSHQ